MLSKPLMIEVHDNYLVIVSDIRQPVYFENLFLTQSNTGLYPVYLDVNKPKTRYTLYSEPVENDLVFHVESINGVKPKDNQEIFNKLFTLLAV